MQVQASPSAVSKLMLLLKDAKFFDSRTDVVSGRFITYNHPLETFATTRFSIKQSYHGRFNAQVPPTLLVQLLAQLEFSSWCILGPATPSLMLHQSQVLRGVTVRWGPGTCSHASVRPGICEFGSCHTLRSQFTGWVASACL